MLSVIPPIVFVVCGLLVFWYLPNWKHARYVKRPDRRVWTLWHIADDNEWTDEGLKLRFRYMVGIALSLFAALVAAVIIRVLSDHP